MYLLTIIAYFVAGISVLIHAIITLLTCKDIWETYFKRVAVFSQV